MKIVTRAAVLAASIAVVAARAASARRRSNAKAYGKRCQGVSEKHVAGQKGTPFSQCVKAGRKPKKVRPAPEPAPIPAPEPEPIPEPTPEPASSARFPRALPSRRAPAGVVPPGRR